MSKETATVHPDNMSRSRRFMYDHGRVIADVSSLSRIPLALLTSHYIKTDQYGKALATYIAIPVTDKADGWASGLSKQGKTEYGGRLDELCDKAAQFIVERALSKKGLLPRSDYGLRTSRDVLMTVYQRPRFTKDGISTSAVISGKGSTVGVFAADLYALTPHGRANETARDSVHHAATGGKIFSFFHEPIVWKRRHEQQQRKKSGERQVYPAA